MLASRRKKPRMVSPGVNHVTIHHIAQSCADALGSRNRAESHCIARYLLSGRYHCDPKNAEDSSTNSIQ